MHDPSKGCAMEPEDFDSEMSRGELINFLGEFLAQNSSADMIYRDHLCSIVVARIFDEFGHEGLCTLMMAIDQRANWISDIIFEQSDFDNAMYSIHGTYDGSLVEKARNSEGIIELNKKIWRLRKKYAREIANEVFNEEAEIDEMEQGE